VSLTIAQTRSIGARTSNVAVRSGIPGRGTRRLSNTLQPASGVVHGEAVGFAAELRPEISSIREGAEVLPHFASAGGVREIGLSLSGETEGPCACSRRPFGSSAFLPPAFPFSVSAC